MSYLPAIKSYLKAGFTLIELSIVLVIIGLIIGGVLVGRDLINAAGVRAQISQIEKYNAAVNTFRGKYGYLPGDIPDPTASSYGFQSRGQFVGEGDGNGILEANPNDLPDNVWGNLQGIGETGVFWVDLSQAGLIGTALNTSAPAGVVPPTESGAAVGLYLPPAKIGGGNYLYAYSGGSGTCGVAGCWTGNEVNYYGLSNVSSITTGTVTSTPGLTVSQAYAIDTKMDDGLPQSGHVLAQFLSSNWDGSQTWAGVSTNGDYTLFGFSVGGPTTVATAGNGQTCYDNNHTGGSIQQYSMGQNNGAGINCALSFQFQ